MIGFAKTTLSRNGTRLLCLVALRCRPERKTAPVCKILSLTVQKMRNVVIVFELVLLRKAAIGTLNGTVFFAGATRVLPQYYMPQICGSAFGMPRLPQNC